MGSQAALLETATRAEEGSSWSGGERSARSADNPPTPRQDGCPPSPAGTIPNTAQPAPTGDLGKVVALASTEHLQMNHSRRFV